MRGRKAFPICNPIFLKFRTKEIMYSLADDLEDTRKERDEAERKIKQITELWPIVQTFIESVPDSKHDKRLMDACEIM